MLGTLQISFFFFNLSILCWIDLQIGQLNHFMGAKGLPFKSQELVTNLGCFRARRILRNKTDFKKRACTQHCPSFPDPTPLTKPSGLGLQQCLLMGLEILLMPCCELLGKKRQGEGRVAFLFVY